MTQELEVFPKDDHNRALVANVHPQDWTNPEPDGAYNLVVIGAGTAGLVTAAVAAGLGAKVALIERHLMGGDCLNVGCVPSKAIIRSARTIGEIRSAGARGIRVPDGVTANFGAVMERMRRVRAKISANDGAQRYTKELGVHVFLGDATFVGPDAIVVDGKRLRFKRAVIATGARAAAPPVTGLAEAGYLTNETVFSLTERPGRLGIIGAGPIGCELAQTFQRLGSDVSLFEMAPQILTREDRDAAEIVQRAFVRDGVHLVLESKLTRVERDGTHKVIHFTRNGAEESLAVDEILVGAGRAPNVQGLGLEAAGIDYDERAGVRVDDHLRTTNPRVYAAGDICMKYKFTHAADAAAKIVVRNALFFGRQKVSDLIMPWCTYTDPEIAHVGLYPHEAEEQGIEIDTFTVALDDVDRAITDGEEEGFVKVHVKKGTDTILGGTVVASHAGDLLNEITLAMVGKLGLAKVGEVIHPYPTQGEAIKRAANAYMRTKLTPGVHRLFSAWMRLLR